MNTVNETLKKIAKRNVAKMRETQSDFELLNEYITMYDLCYKGGNDELFILYLIEELGYAHCKSGGFIKL